MAEVGRDERHVYLGPMPRPSSAINSASSIRAEASRAPAE